MYILMFGDFLLQGIHVGMSNEHQEIEQIRKKLEKYEEDMCKIQTFLSLPYMA